MKKKSNLILVDASVLPEVFIKVLRAKRLLESGEAKTVNEATAAVGISRSAFYKYKDYVFSVNSMQGIITLSFMLLDIKGILSRILSVLSDADANILTINQNIPVDGVANITISLQAEDIDLEELLGKLEKIDGVKNIDVLSNQANRMR